MPTAVLARLVSRCQSASAPDADLLRRFVRTADADAFAELLGRYAGLVWGVCRRTLPQEADAEDAFQAVFLALARNARSIDPHRPLAGWLHAVAVRIARRALGKALRRRTSELPECPGPADVLHEVSSRDLFRAIDEEIGRLPTALREPVVLCGLEGRARDEAADLLGCSVAAVKARLERGRQALRHALARRGIALPVAFAVLGLGAGRVGAGLKAQALKAALGSPSPAVVALAAAPSSCVWWAGVALAAAVMLGVGVVGSHPESKGPPPAAKDPPPARTDEPKARVDRFGDPLPDGAVRRFGTLRFRHESVAALAFTPDGKRLIAGVGRDPLAVFDPADGRKLTQIGEKSANNNYGFALSPDGKHVYCTGYHLTSYDVATGARGRAFDDAVRCNTVAVSPDGKRVAVAREHQSGAAMILDAETGKKVADLNLNDLPANAWGPTVHGLAFSPDGKVAAGIVARVEATRPNVLNQVPVGLRLWDTTTGDVLGTAGPADDWPQTFAFVPGTKLIACLGKGGVIHLWDTGVRKVTRTIPLPKGDEAAADLAVSADGRRLAVYLKAGAVAVFDVPTGKEVRRVDARNSAVGPAAITLSPDGSLVACGKMYGDSSVRVWEVGTGKERLADTGHRGPAKLLMSADGQALVSRGAGQVFRWDLATGEGKAKPDDETDADGPVPDPNWSKAVYRTPRHRFTVEHGSGRIEVHTRDGHKVVARSACPKDFSRGTAHSADGRYFAISFQDAGRTVLLWDANRIDEPVRLAGHPDAVQQMAFTPDGKHLIAGAGTHNNYPTETLFVYETRTGRLVRKLNSHSAPGHMIVTADNRTLVTGGLWNDATVRVWDLATGKDLATLVDPAVTVPSLPRPNGEEVPSVGGLALSGDQRFLAVLTGSAGKSSLTVWDTASWKPVQAFAPAKPRCDAASLAVGRDGRSVFVAYLDSTILEWAVARPTATAPTAARLNDLWQALGDPEGGYAAAWELLDHPAGAVAFLRTRLAPAAPPDAVTIRDLVGKLGSDVFREREEAGRRLTALGEAALPVVKEAAAGKLSAEARERVDRVIVALAGGVTPEQLRQRRAVAVLEWSSRSDADDLLRKVATGDVNARLTKEARAAVGRRGR